MKLWISVLVGTVCVESARTDGGDVLGTSSGSSEPTLTPSVAMVEMRRRTVTTHQPDAAPSDDTSDGPDWGETVPLLRSHLRRLAQPESHDNHDHHDSVVINVAEEKMDCCDPMVFTDRQEAERRMVGFTPPLPPNLNKTVDGPKHNDEDESDQDSNEEDEIDQDSNEEDHGRLARLRRLTIGRIVRWFMALVGAREETEQIQPWFDHREWTSFEEVSHDLLLDIVKDRELCPVMLSYASPWDTFTVQRQLVEQLEWAFSQGDRAREEMWSACLLDKKYGACDQDLLAHL